MGGVPVSMLWLLLFLVLTLLLGWWFFFTGSGFTLFWFLRRFLGFWLVYLLVIFNLALFFYIVHIMFECWWDSEWNRYKLFLLFINRIFNVALTLLFLFLLAFRIVRTLAAWWYRTFWFFIVFIIFITFNFKIR